MKLILKSLFYIITGTLLVISLSLTIQSTQNVILFFLFLAALLINVFSNTYPKVLNPQIKKFIILIIFIIVTIFFFIPKDFNTCVDFPSGGNCKKCKCLGITGIDITPFCLGKIYNCY